MSNNGTRTWDYVAIFLKKILYTFTSYHLLYIFLHTLQTECFGNMYYMYK